MLYQIGSVQITHNGLNAYEVSRQASADFAEKDVIGVLKPAEPVGEGDDVLKLTCKVFTMNSPGALAAIDALDQMRLAQEAVICVRGDGYNYGWRRIVDVAEKHRKLDLAGVGKVVEYEITLKKHPKPSPQAIVQQLYSIAVGGLRGLFSELVG